MTTREPTLTDQDHDDMDTFLSNVLDDFKAGKISKDQVTGGLAQVIAAIDTGNYGEATNWFRQGRELMRSGR